MKQNVKQKAKQKTLPSALLTLSVVLFLLLGTAACGRSSTDSSAADSQTAQANTNTEPAGKTNPEETDDEDTDDEDTRPDGWTTASHSNDADPDYSVVFPSDAVNEITITIAPEEWEAMQANMTELYGEPGEGSGPGGAGFQPPADGEVPEGFQPPADGELPEGFQPPGGGEAPEGFQPPADGELPFGGRGGRGGPGGSFSSENPMWVEATIEFNGTTWTHVGVRYKGNSSLMSSWNSGTQKLPFKFDFDEFEDDYPEIDNQRFYGFKQLSLANGFGDATYMRDAISYDLLAEAGLAASETAFYNLTLDYGEGPVDLGVYTVIEVIDDTVVDRYFGNDDGNIYEGDGSAASLAQGTFDAIDSSFQKENNEDEADWSDIESLYNVLHAEQRTTDPAAWRAELESIFDVESFLEWLALSATLEHWDTYGGMSHNYYLYHNPEIDQLTWISWDHNLVLGSSIGGGRGGGFGGGFGGPPGGQANEAPEAGADDGAAAPAGDFGGGPGGHNVTLDRENVSDQWPLIRYLLDDPIYMASYMNYLQETIDTVFLPDQLADQYAAWADLLAPYVDDEATFRTAVESLTAHTLERAETVEAFLNEQ